MARFEALASALRSSSILLSSRRFVTSDASLEKWCMKPCWSGRSDPTFGSVRDARPCLPILNALARFTAFASSAAA